jgi:xanthine dehydrogenase YagR molybdenum-binding subunit
MSIIQKAMQTAIRWTPEGWLPGGTPDSLMYKHGLIGKPVSRIDGRLKVTGKARFAAEVPLEGMEYAALLFSTIARGQIVTLDTTEAEASAGVTLVMTYRNAPRMKPPPMMLSVPKAAGISDLPVMQDTEIHWNGQPIALVLAETQEQADHAVSLIHVSYNRAPSVTSFDAAKARTPDNILGEPSLIEIGDAEAALKNAAFRVDLTYRTPRYNHNAIELHAATVAWDGDKLTVHDASQMVNATAWTLAQVFGLKEEQVRVLSPYVGGGSDSAARGFGIIRYWPPRLRG